MDVPCPPMNYVVEWVTICAPHSNGRHRYRVAKVLSTINGMPNSFAIAATSSKGKILTRGLLIISPYKTFVLGRMALRKFSGFDESTNVTSIPRRGNVY